MNYKRAFNKVSDSVNADEFLANFEPYIIDEENTGRNSIELTLGDKNSDVQLLVSVYDITDYGLFKFDIEEIMNVSEDEEELIINDDIVWDAVSDFISNEVVFDETH